MATTEKTNSLTKRETEILHLISMGHSCAKVAETLFISVHTVRKHRQNMISKSGGRNITQLMVSYIQSGV